jgi:hypothetical protein
MHRSLSARSLQGALDRTELRTKLVQVDGIDEFVRFCGCRCFLLARRRKGEGERDVPRLGDIDPAQEPYRTELGRDKMLVFDLTRLATAGDDAHNRAFSDVTSVMGMIQARLNQGQSMTDHRTGS